MLEFFFFFLISHGYSFVWVLFLRTERVPLVMLYLFVPRKES